MYIITQYLRGFLPIYSNLFIAPMLYATTSITAKTRNENKIESIIKGGDAVILLIGIKTWNSIKKMNIITTNILFFSHQSFSEIIPLPIVNAGANMFGCFQNPAISIQNFSGAKKSISKMS